MSFKIRKVEYFYCSIVDQPGEAYKMLTQLEQGGINLLAFTAIPVGPDRTQLTLFPEVPANLVAEAKRSSFALDGPHPALLVQGDDELGALTNIHQILFSANVNVYASNGVTDSNGSFGYLLYVRPEEYERAASALKV
ncbi:MAG: hypothetical protein OQJ78_02860 [Ignavibacteriaceae bacterium]|jgi:hypothetical protein|nr:hypothetical protein [Ignavibacteriaceae bacterium]